MFHREKFKKLFTELGETPEQSEARLLEIVNELYQTLASDLMIGFFFDGKDLNEIAQKQTTFILKAMGTRAKYEGKNPTSAHLSLPPIRTGHFDRRLVLLREVLKKNNLSETSTDTWVEFENSFRSVVIQNP